MGNIKGLKKICSGFLLGILCLLVSSLCWPGTKIMPLGDSITRGVGPGELECEVGYRRTLFLDLSNAGYIVDFVGNETHPKAFCDDLYGVPIDFDNEHEGYPGKKAEYIRDNIYNQGGDWLGVHPADIILLHIGTNDLNSGQAPGDIVTEVSQILERIDQYENANGKGVHVILARIINRVPLSSKYTQYNTELAAMAQTRIANGDKLTIVDMENGAGINYDTEMNDAYHPDENGYAKMADIWYNAIEQMLLSCTDGDGDGFSSQGGVCGEIDCDDSNPLIHPNATEICNEKDDDCDGSADEGVKETFFRDADGDSYGNPNDSTQGCTSLEGYVVDNTDCNDSDGFINPAAAEICTDLKDNDCDNSLDCVDEECSSDLSCAGCSDNDDDGYFVEGGLCGPADCNDLDASVHPGITEVCDDAIDNNCNGLGDCHDVSCSDDYICTADVDNDGMADFEEKGPLGTDDMFDADGDGISDHQQDSVVSCHTHDGSHYITLICPLGLRGVQAIPVPPDPPAGVSFPYGFFEFTIVNLPDSGAAMVVFFLGEHMDTFYKYGPTNYGSSIPEWYAFNYDSRSMTGAKFGESSVNVTYVDGLKGDDDLSENGMIVDQGGPGLTDFVPPFSNSGSSGGCSISGVKMNSTDASSLCPLMIITGLWIRFRRKK